jgi:hypothetical protein
MCPAYNSAIPFHHEQYRMIAQLNVVSMSLYVTITVIYLLSIIALNSSVYASTSSTLDRMHDFKYSYCVIGAGPGGLQMGYYLEQASREWRRQFLITNAASSHDRDIHVDESKNPYRYILLDRSTRGAGEFFRHFPRHRTLISINKRFTGSESKEFNLRHDWNSLLSDYSKEFSNQEDINDAADNDLSNSSSTPADTPRFGSFSRLFYPHADEYVSYLESFTNIHHIHIKYNSSVVAVKRIPLHDTTSSSSSSASTSKSSDRLTDRQELTYRDRNSYIYQLNVQHPNANITSATANQEDAASINSINQYYQCRYLLAATGLSLPIIPNGVIGLSPPAPSYTSSSSAAADSIDAISSHRSTKKFPALVVEQYSEFNPDPELFANQSVLILGKGNSAMETIQSLLGTASHLHMVGQSPIRLAHHTHYVGDVRAINDEILDLYQLKSLGALLDVPIQKDTVEFIRDPITGKIEFRPFGLDKQIEQLNAERKFIEAADRMESVRMKYDRIISCLGFRIDSSLFVQEIGHSALGAIKLSPGIGKYLSITASYESSDIRWSNLYSVGTLQHVRDFKKSSGGFIHGFRYSVRSLFKILNQRNHHKSWPAVKLPNILTDEISLLAISPSVLVGGSTTLPSSSPIIHILAEWILQRVNEQSAMYQMFGVLHETLIIRSRRNNNNNHNTIGGVQNIEFEWLTDIPRDYLLSNDMLDRYDNGTASSALGILVLSLEFNPCFSHTQSDVLGRGRQVNDIHRAADSNFLHPVLKYYAFPLAKEFDINQHAPTEIHHVGFQSKDRQN